MILIVGGAGYIGSHANKELTKRGYKTLILDNLIYGHQESVQWGEFIEGDLGDTTRLRKIFTQYKIDAVMHFAAFAYVGESVTDPKKYSELPGIDVIKFEIFPPVQLSAILIVFFLSINNLPTFS